VLTLSSVNGWRSSCDFRSDRGDAEPFINFDVLAKSEKGGSTRVLVVDRRDKSQRLWASAARPKVMESA
jgi:hypothetical protein